MFECMSTQKSREKNIRKLESCIYFFLRVYFSEAGFTHHLANAPGDKMQKILLQNSSPFFHTSFKMFECMSTQKNREKNIRQFFPDMVYEQMK